MNNDRVYEAFHGTGVDDETKRLTRQRIAWIISHVPAGDIADVGCSQGVTAMLLAQRGDRVIGIDIESPALSFAREQSLGWPSDIRRRVGLVQGDAQRLPLPTNAVDCVVMGEVLEHVDDPESVLEEAYRVVKPKGSLVVTVPYGVMPHPDHKRVFYRRTISALVDPLFEVVECTVLSRHIGLRAVRRAKPAGALRSQMDLDELLFAQRETEYIEALDALRERLTAANLKYRQVTAALPEKQDRIRELENELRKAGRAFDSAQEDLKRHAIEASSARDLERQVRRLTQQLDQAAAAAEGRAREAESLRSQLVAEQAKAARSSEESRRLATRLQSIERSRAWSAILRYRKIRRALRRRHATQTASLVEDRKPETGGTNIRSPQAAAPAAAVPAVAATSVSLSDFEASFDAWAERARSSGAPEVVFMYSGTTFVQEARANRPIRLTRVYLDQGIPVFFSYWRWRATDPLPETDHPLLFQSPVDLTRRILDRLLAERFDGMRKVAFASFPEELMVRALLKMTQAGWSTIYDARDDWEEFERVGMAKWYRRSFETYVAKSADVVTAVSSPLARKIRVLADRDDVLVVPNALDPAFPRAERRPADPTTIGYFGHLTDKWFDWNLVRLAAQKHPSWRFEIAGHGEPDGLSLPPNVELLGLRKHQELAEIASSWSAAIIPFRFGRLTEAVDPIKVYEYLHLGLPVLSTYMPQISQYPSVLVAESPDEFLQRLSAVVEMRPNQGLVDAWLKQNTWELRVQAYREALESLHRQKAPDVHRLLRASPRGAAL